MVACTLGRTRIIIRNMFLFLGKFLNSLHQMYLLTILTEKLIMIQNLCIICFLFMLTNELIFLEGCNNLKAFLRDDMEEQMQAIQENVITVSIKDFLANLLQTSFGCYR